MIKITDFLLSRIEDDEATASSVPSNGKRFEIGPSQMSTEIANHVMVWTPRRALAESAVKRLAVLRFIEGDQTMEPIVRAMASVYSDHEDFQPEWAPQAS